MEKFYAISVLIVPCGIEMDEAACVGVAADEVLIVPCGIEITNA